MSEDAYCELSFSPNVDLISTVRRFVGDFYQRVLGDAELASRIVVATHELLENAVRYSSDAQSKIRLSIEDVSPTEVDVVISTENRSSDAHRQKLIELIEAMHADPDAQHFYQALVRGSARRKEGSGLGLGRIHAESEMSVDVDVDGDRVRLRAHARFRRPTAPAAPA
ncbi:MAG: ATP-binding protein [Polyangiaceae bacterium]